MYIFPKAIRMIIGYPAIKCTKKHKTARIHPFCTIIYSSMERYSYVGEHSFVGHADIGAYTSIASYCAIGNGEHPLDWVSTSPVFNKSRSILRVRFADHEFNPYKRTRIGNDVWIGAHCLIKSGVTIGDGAVIGMGSVVTKDVSAYEIWAGNPARKIRDRFSTEIIEGLMSLRWWTMSEQMIRRYACFCNDPLAYIENAKPAE